MWNIFEFDVCSSPPKPQVWSPISPPAAKLLLQDAKVEDAGFMTSESGPEGVTQSLWCSQQLVCWVCLSLSPVFDEEKMSSGVAYSGPLAWQQSVCTKAMLIDGAVDAIGPKGSNLRRYFYHVLVDAALQENVTQTVWHCHASNSDRANCHKTQKNQHTFTP